MILQAETPVAAEVANLHAPGLLSNRRSTFEANHVEYFPYQGLVLPEATQVPQTTAQSRLDA